MEEEEFAKHILAGENDFPYFVNNIFSHSLDNFVGGKHIDDIAKLLQENKETVRVSAREHFKSMSLYAHIMSDLLYNPGLEGHYFSYNASMSSYHLGKVKQCISRNLFFDDLIDLKPTAEGILKYSWDREKITTIDPCGLLGFKRGIHAPRIYVDDPLRDPENKLNPTIVNKINRIITTEVVSMLNPGGQMHVVGTPQTQFDFFFDKKVTEGMAVKIQPAVLDWENKISLWPEYWPWERLMLRKRKISDRVFNQEFMCKPVWTEQAWFSREKLMSVVNPVLQQKKEQLQDNYTVLGIDIGKKVHPAYVCIFEEDKTGHWKQIYSRFLDEWGYDEQVKHLNDLVNRFKVDEGAYDNTRGEYESYVERGELPSVLEPVIFKTTNKHSMATNFEKMVENKEVELLKDRRMINQILVVDNDLQALETPEGHGDSFWGIALALSIAGQKTDTFDSGF